MLSFPSLKHYITPLLCKCLPIKESCNLVNIWIFLFVLLFYVENYSKMQDFLKSYKKILIHFQTNLSLKMWIILFLFAFYFLCVQNILVMMRMEYWKEKSASRYFRRKHEWTWWQFTFVLRGIRTNIEVFIPGILFK